MIEKNLILDYDLICGRPGEVAERVQELIGLCEGWQPKGKPIKMKLANCECEILIQCMVKNGDAVADGLFEEFIDDETTEVLIRRRGNENEN